MVELQTRRALFLDDLRGFMMINVILYHLFYDLVFLFGVSMPWFLSPGAYRWQEVMSCTFIAVAGACTRYSRNTWRRGLQVLGWAMALTLATWLAMPEITIRFGVLHLIGVSTLVAALLRPALDKLPPWAGMAACALLYCVTFEVWSGHWGFGPFLELEVPPVLYSTPWLFWLGLPAAGFSSGDYFPLLPYLFVFLGGVYWGRLIKEERMPPFFYRTLCRPLSFVGRHTLWIYLAHQPLVYLVLLFVFHPSL